MKKKEREYIYCVAFQQRVSKEGCTLRFQYKKLPECRGCSARREAGWDNYTSNLVWRFGRVGHSDFFMENNNRERKSFLSWESAAACFPHSYIDVDNVSLTMDSNEELRFLWLEDLLNLSSETRTIVLLLLNAPKDFMEAVESTGFSIKRFRAFVRKQYGWSHDTFNKTIKEIKNYLKE